ncbi:hypothetical protein L3Y34_001321 [Caenorhabditis briggsae]|uniref:Uncharacterized protein n=1 Tax=Caenorhabditis briggsae TaxID=6238 RepID=A0AAE9IPA9_CAEBR|nr:hypothetical protein L3Y34_001321 [Caenorhabditis briggsae]
MTHTTGNFYHRILRNPYPDQFSIIKTTPKSVPRLPSDTPKSVPRSPTQKVGSRERKSREKLSKEDVKTARKMSDETTNDNKVKTSREKTNHQSAEKSSSSDPKAGEQKQEYMKLLPFDLDFFNSDPIGF